MTKWMLGLLLGAAALGCAEDAAAQEQPEQAHEVAVAVPGLRAVHGDDAVANELTGWLRAGASAVQGWRLHTAMVSLEQFMIVHGCEEADEELSCEDCRGHPNGQADLGLPVQGTRRGRRWLRLRSGPVLFRYVDRPGREDLEATIPEDPDHASGARDHGAKRSSSACGCPARRARQGAGARLDLES